MEKPLLAPQGTQESLFSGTATEGSLDFAWLEGRPRRRQVFDFLHPGEDLVRHYSSLFCRLADAYRWFLPAMVVVNVLQALAELAILHWRLAIGLWSSRVAVLAFTAGSFSMEVALRLWSCIEEHPSLAERPILNRLRFLVKPLNSLDVLTVCLVWASLLLTVRDTQVSHMEVYFRLATALSMAAGGAAKSHSQLLRKDRSDTSLQPEKVLKYNFEADSWNVNVTFKKRRDRNRRSIFENLPQEDAFGFDPKSGRYFRLLLVISAALSSLVSFTVDRGSEILQAVTNGTLDFVQGRAGQSMPLDFAVLFLCTGAMLWCAYGLVRLCPEAAGSGLPEVKCILSGIQLERFLSAKVLLAKSVGLALVLGAALPVGKEGPFVHIASCMSALLLKSERCFASVSLDRQEVLLAAVAVGVGATFSAPVGGVLFALELMMPRLYDTSSYSACFFASTFGTFVFMCLNMLFSGDGQLKPLFNSDITPGFDAGIEAEILFLVLSSVTGALSGALASAFVICHRRAVGGMNSLRGLTKAAPSAPRDLAIFLGAGGVGAFLRVGVGSALLTLGTGPFLSEIFGVEAHLRHSELASFAPVLFLLLTKTSYTIMALSMPIPAGVVAPSLMIGGLLGRVIASLLPPFCWRILAPNGSNEGEYIARLAIVGATCFCGAVCRVNSVVVTVFELIAVPRLILPLTLATIVSNFWANRVGPSIFDSILLMKKIPAMPTLRASARALQPVKMILNPGLLGLCLPRLAQNHDFVRLRFAKHSMEKEGRNVPAQVPIVEEVQIYDRPRLVLLGAVTWEDLDALQISEGSDMLLAAAQLGKVLKDPLRVSPHDSLKKAYIDSQMAAKEGPMMVVEDGFLVGILPHPDLVGAGMSEKRN